MPSVTLTFKTTAAQARALRRAARARGMTLSEYLRRVALGKELDALAPAPASDLSPGRVVIAAAPGAPTVDKAMIEAALAD